MRAVNRETFIERLKQGPAQFLEFAGTRSANASQRKDAIKVRDELLAEGVIRLVYIGHYPYLILASKEAEDQALRQYLEENIRIDRETGCKVWQGVFDGRGRPIMRMSLISNRVINVRRYFWELERHDKLSVTDVATMRGTCEDGCINSEHMVKERRSQNMRGKPKSLTQRIRMSKAIAELRGKAAQYVELIRTSDKTCKELAIETGMSASNVSLIRRGHTFRFQNGVFTGLIAANQPKERRTA